MSRVVVWLCVGAFLLLFTTLGASGIACAQDQAASTPAAASGSLADIPTDQRAHNLTNTLQNTEGAGYASGNLRAGFTGLVPLFRTHGLALSGNLAATSLGFGDHPGEPDSFSFHPTWAATLRAAVGSFSLNGGYAGFYTPGSWASNGAWIDPVDIKGPIVSASLNLMPNLALSANGNFYQGAAAFSDPASTSEAIQSPLSNAGERLNHYDVGLKYGVTSQYSVDLGYEWDQWALNNYAQSALGISSGHPTEQYITIGVGHSFNKNASLKVLYQILDYNDEGADFDYYAGGPDLNGKEHGGVAVTQFSIKF